MYVGLGGGLRADDDIPDPHTRTHLNARRALFCEGHTNFMAPFYSAADVHARACVCVWVEMTGLDSLNLLFSLSLLAPGEDGQGPSSPCGRVYGCRIRVLDYVN